MQNGTPEPQHQSHYSLRTRTTQNKNPAKSVGLVKRTRDEITTEVNAKKAKQKAVDDAKAATKAREEQHRTTHVARIAALEDELAEYEDMDCDLDLFCEYSHLMDCVGGRTNTSVGNRTDAYLFGSPSPQEW